MDRKPIPFIRIDQQGWFCHFHTRYRGWFYKPSAWLLSQLRKYPGVEVVNTYDIDNGSTIRELRPEGKEKS